MKNLTASVLILFSLLAIQFGCSEQSKNDANAKTETVTPKIKFKLVAAIIKNDGTIIPVPKTDFMLRQFNEEKLRLGIQKRAIRESNVNYEKYKQICIKKQDPILMDTLRNKDPKYEAIRKHMKESIDSCIKLEMADEIDRKMAKELPSMFEEMQKKYPTIIKVKTDLSGSAIVEAPLGTWHISGSYSFNKSSKVAEIKSLVTWDYPVEVKPGLEKVELSNDNQIDIENFSYENGNVNPADEQ